MTEQKTAPLVVFHRINQAWGFFHRVDVFDVNTGQVCLIDASHNKQSVSWSLPRLIRHAQECRALADDLQAYLRNTFASLGERSLRALPCVKTGFAMDAGTGTWLLMRDVRDSSPIVLATTGTVQKHLDNPLLVKLLERLQQWRRQMEAE